MGGGGEEEGWGSCACIEQDLQALCICLLDPGAGLSGGWAASVAGSSWEAKSSSYLTTSTEASNSLRTGMAVAVHTS